MNQLDIFTDQRRVETPIARNTDPITSHLAAEHVTKSGARAHQNAQVAAAVRAFPGKTGFELAMASQIDRYVVARRLPECERAGLVHREGARKCGVTGRMALTWAATQPSVT